ncbi:MAG: hypothetical protein V1646_04370 [bacterium]
MLRNKFVNFTFIIYLISQSLYAENEKSGEIIKNNSSIIKRIVDINMKSFDWRGDHWDCNTNVEFIRHLEKFITQPSLPRKRSMAFTLFEKEEEHSNKVQIMEDNGNSSSHNLRTAKQGLGSTWQDLDLFCGKSNVKKFVANSIDMTVTEIGKVSLYCLLAAPTPDVELLRKRQHIISVLKDNRDLCKALDTALQSIKRSENILLSFWEDNPLNHMTDHMFFPKFLNLMNKSEDLLLFKSLLGKTDMSIGFVFKIITTAALLSYGILHLTNVIDAPERVKNWADENHNLGVGMSGGWMASYGWKMNNKLVHSLLSIFLGISCASTLHWDVDMIHGSYLCERFIQLMMINMARVFESMTVIYELLKNHPELERFDEFKSLINLFEKQIKEIDDIQDLFELMQQNTFKGNPSMLSHQGSILKAYDLMQKLKEKFESALVCVARIDAYFSISKLFNENENKRNYWCFPKYQINEKPFIKLTDFWHPLTNQNKVVTNSITLGIDNNRPNVIVTGPNEARKSTALKAVTLCLIMAQTMGVAPAREMVLTPFSSISTYLNITDDIGVGNSLFKAEILRVQKLINIVQNAKSGEFHFAIFDEIFNGTSPVEGSAAAYSVAKHLGSFENSICMIATHFNLLTRLEAETNYFANYKVYVIKKDNGQIDYPYKIECGISDQNVVFDILKNEGFESSIINDAQSLIS